MWKGTLQTILSTTWWSKTLSKIIKVGQIEKSFSQKFPRLLRLKILTWYQTAISVLSKVRMLWEWIWKMDMTKHWMDIQNPILRRVQTLKIIEAWSSWRIIKQFQKKSWKSLWRNLRLIKWLGILMKVWILVLHKNMVHLIHSTARSPK